MSTSLNSRPKPELPTCPVSRLLEGQKALVTGASSGIGKAIAIAIHADVSMEEQVIALFRRTIGALGTVDILVNNAGVQQDAPIGEMTLAQWKTVLGVNLTGQFLCAREAIPEFRRRIVEVVEGLSRVGLRPFPLPVALNRDEVEGDLVVVACGAINSAALLLGSASERHPQARILDLDCRAHDLDNLYVVDGSFFPSISSVNPALTIMANALRVADGICERLCVTRRRAKVV